MTVKSLGRHLPPHWYEISIWECVLCGQTDVYRERKFTPKPEDPNERYHYHQTACDIHFM